MKKLIVVLIALVITSAAFAEEKRFMVPLDNSPAMGPENAPITIVEFIDFQ